MKKKIKRSNFSELDKFDRKQRRHTSPKSKYSKYKKSIYLELEDEDDFDLNY